MAVRPGSRSDAESVRLPARSVAPVVAITRRLLGAMVILLAVVAAVLIDRDGYRDVTGNRIGVLDAFYYTTVTLSTTGYGDVTPVSSSARLVNVLFVTPARVLFLIILVGTTLEVLTERSREQFRIRRWRSRVREHVVVCGYGTKGRSAVAALLEDGTPLDRIVVVEQNGNAAREATDRGLVVVQGSSSRSDVLRQAEIGTAKAVVVATDTDDATVLTVLTARDLAPRAWIAAAVRETENIPLVRQSGADQVVVSSATAGRLLGLSTSAPQLVTSSRTCSPDPPASRSLCARSARTRSAGRRANWASRSPPWSAAVSCATSPTRPCSGSTTATGCLHHRRRPGDGPGSGPGAAVPGEAS